MPSRQPHRLAAAGLVAALAATTAHAQPITLQTVAGYGTFHAGGVVATVSGDADQDSTAALAWRVAGGGAFTAAHPLVRISPTQFAGSLFWLTPGTSYEARVTLSDPDGVAGSPQTASLATRAATLPEPTLRTLYVAPTGSDGNPGTNPGAPLLTIQHAADLAQAGDLISIAPGVYRESVEVPASGTALQPIVFRGSGPGVVLDGADEDIFEEAPGIVWTHQGNGVHWLDPGFATGHVVTDLGRLFRYDSLADLTALPAGAPGGFWFDGSRLRVKLSGGGSPANRQMHVARLEDGFYLNMRSYVRIENVEIRHYGSGDYGKGVYLRYTTECAVRGSRIHQVGAAGVWIKGGTRNLVEDSEIWDSSIFDWPWDWTKGSSAENNGVSMTDDVGRGNVIRRNRIHGVFNGIGPCGASAPPAGVTSETDVYENEFSEHTDDGLEPEGYCSNVRIWGNRITDTHMAFAVAPAAVGPTWIVRNVAYDFGNTRTSQQDGYTASALKINSGYPDPIGPLLLYHNTLLTTAPGTDALALLDNSVTTYIRSRNNVIAGTQYALYKVNGVTLQLDWDDLWTTDPTRFVRWMGTQYPTLGEFQTGTLQEPNGLAAAPLLTDPASGSFRPQAGSPLVDRGVAIPGINDGWVGTAPDIGALEWSAAIFDDGFETGDTSRWSATVE